MPETLTDAEVDALEERERHAKHGPDPDEMAALFTALRQARGMVAALAADDPIYPGGRDGDEPECWFCRAEFWHYDPQDNKHADDCAWKIARSALAAWRDNPD